MAQGSIRLVAGVACLLGLGVAAGMGLSRALPAQPQDEMDHEAMMAEMAKMGQPGEHHRKLDAYVGEWDAHASFTMPDGSTVESKGHLTSEWVLGGRFVKGDFHLDNLFGPFDGISYMGYDNAKGAYFSIWMDSFSTKAQMMQTSVEGEAFVSLGESSHGTEMKIVSQMKDDNTAVDEFFDKTPDGQWIQTGTITYTRK